MIAKAQNLCSFLIGLLRDGSKLALGHDLHPGQVQLLQQTQSKQESQCCMFSRVRARTCARACSDKRKDGRKTRDTAKWRESH